MFPEGQNKRAKKDISAKKESIVLDPFYYQELSIVLFYFIIKCSNISAI
jgi:hypothetical protein